MLPKKYRLNKPKTVSYVLKRGKGFYGKYIRLFHLLDINQSFHLAIIVSKKNIKKAVDRNRIKRRIKAIFYNSQTNKGYNFVVIVNKQANEASFKELNNEILLSVSKI